VRAAIAIRQGAWNSSNAPGVGTCCVEDTIAQRTQSLQTQANDKTNAVDSNDEKQEEEKEEES
jgi:hypothetical protein